VSGWAGVQVPGGGGTLHNAAACSALPAGQSTRRIASCPALAGLSTYPAYMAGGGYVVSSDVAAALVSTHQGHIPLKHTAAEDVTMSMWLLPLDLRRIDHPRFKTRAEHCCVVEAERWVGGRVAAAAAAAATAAYVCHSEAPAQLCGKRLAGLLVRRTTWGSPQGGLHCSLPPLSRAPWRARSCAGGEWCGWRGGLHRQRRRRRRQQMERCRWRIACS
jgi:hypothetical protein